MQRSSPNILLPLLHCPLCSPSRPLTDPTTLRCGHTVCSSHISSASCPVPSCSSVPANFTPVIPATSQVAFFPATSDSRPQITPSEAGERRIDVRVKNIVELVLKVAADEGVEHDELVDTYSDSGDDSDGEEDEPVRFPSSSSPNVSPATGPFSDPSGSNPLDHLSSTSSSSSRPRKRPRRHTSDSRHPSDPGDTSLLAEFDKSLTTELTCEICFMLFYQPVTTPCQHVRISRFCSV